MNTWVSCAWCHGLQGHYFSLTNLTWNVLCFEMNSLSLIFLFRFTHKSSIRSWYQRLAPEGSGSQASWRHNRYLPDPKRGVANHQAPPIMTNGPIDRKWKEKSTWIVDLRGFLQFRHLPLNQSWKKKRESTLPETLEQRRALVTAVQIFSFPKLGHESPFQWKEMCQIATLQ